MKDKINTLSFISLYSRHHCLLALGSSKQMKESFGKLENF